MRIAFVCGFAWEPKGTVRARAFPLAAELVKRGHEVTMFLVPYDNPGQSNKQEVRDGVRIVNMQVNRAPGLYQAPAVVNRLYRAVKRYAADVVHVFKPKGYAGAACSWLLMKGFRALALDCDDWEGWGGWNDVKPYPWILKAYIDRQEKWLVRRAPVVTAASRVLERRAVALRESPSGVFYIPNCTARQTENEVPSPAGAQPKQSFGLAQNAVIFYGGHFDPADDTLFFCRAAAPAARRFRATLVFAGEGPDLPRAKDFFSRHADIDVRFFPQLPYKQFLQLVAASDIAAFPYPDSPIYRAKCSARIVDYMALGKAVVTTAVGQNTEYIVDQVSGILVPSGNESSFGEALETLLADPNLRSRLGQQARVRIAENFSWDGMAVENCLTAYRQLYQS